MKKILVMLAISTVFSFCILNSRQALAEEKEDKGSAALISALTTAKVSLADGIRQAAKGTEAPISAKYELDEKGNLSLSVYTAEKGLSVDQQNNNFKEISGSPESATWSPEAEVIKDEGDLVKAKEQLTVLSKAKISLSDILEKAKKDYQGIILAATPEVEGGKSVCEIRIVKDGKVSEYHYDVATGNEVKMDKDADDKY